MTDWRGLCTELLQAIDDDVLDVADGPRFQAVVDRIRAALLRFEVCLTITDADSEKINKGDVIELSAFYKVDYDPTPGVTPEGEAYDGIQRNIRFLTTMTDRSTIDLESARFNDIRKNLCTIAFSDMRADIEAYWADWAEAQKPPTLDDDIVRLAFEHFPYMRRDDYGSGFIPVSMHSPTLGRDLLNFAHAVRALPLPSSPTPETPC